MPPIRKLALSIDNISKVSKYKIWVYNKYIIEVFKVRKQRGGADGK